MSMLIANIALVLLLGMVHWLILIMPVQDEVRALGRLPALNVPEAFITRHPFPGAHPSSCAAPCQILSCSAKLMVSFPLTFALSESAVCQDRLNMTQGVLNTTP